MKPDAVWIAGACGRMPVTFDKYMKNIGTLIIILCMLALFVVLSQPAWRGEEMVRELQSDCDKRGGVMLEHKKTFGTTYQCVSRLD